MIGALASAVLLLLQVQAAPYKAMSNDHLASVCSFSLSTVFLCCLGYKYAGLTDLEDIRAKMNRGQKGVYIFDTAILTTIIVLCVFAALVASTLIFFIQVAVESVRRRRLALADKARRLRYAKNDKEVLAPPLTTKGVYHTFLSHVWGTGQDQMRIVKQRLLEIIPGLSVFLDVDDLEDISNLQGYIERTHQSNTQYSSTQRR